MCLGLQIPLAAGFERCDVSWEEVSSLPNPKHGGPGPHIYDPAIHLGIGKFLTSGVLSLPVLTISVGPLRGQMNYLNLICAMVKNEWRYTSTPPVCLHGLYKDTFTYTLNNLNFNNLVNESCCLILPV